jgi:two-component system, NtrC family, response regulator PilR
MVEARILLVEDDAYVLALLSLALLAAEYVVDTASTVAEGMARLAGMSYSLVATDWRLPDGDGMEIADHAANRGAKTIIFTGYVFHIPAEITTRHEWLMKPMQHSDFVSAVRRRLGEATTATVAISN